MIDHTLVIVSVTFLVIITPGPDMVIVLRNTLVGGRRAGLETSTDILALVSRRLFAKEDSFRNEFGAT